MTQQVKILAATLDNMILVPGTPMEGDFPLASTFMMWPAHTHRPAHMHTR